MIELFDLLAQTTQETEEPTPGPSGGEMFVKQILPIFLIIGVFWWIMSRGRSKERKRYQEMLNSLKRSDRVQTVGGIIGTVVDVRDDEVVLKVDETNNVKVRFNRTAIKDVLRDAAEGK